MFREMSFLTEAFAAQAARERLFAGVSTDMNIDRVLVLEALRADGAVVERALFSNSIAHGTGSRT